MDIQAVVLAAGKGSRMLDLTSDHQKYLLPLANMPMIWYSLHYLQNAGFKEAIVLSSEGEIEMHKAIEKEFTITLDVVTVPDSEDMGTADSLRIIRNKIRSDVLVISSDVVTDFPLYQLLDVYRLHGASFTALFSPVADSMKEMSVPGPRTKQKYEKDFVGLEKNTSRLIFLSSEADFEEFVPLKKSILKKHPQVQLRNNLLDAHIYVLKKWVLDYLSSDPNVSTIKGELVPLLVKKQFSAPKNPPQNANAEASLRSLKSEDKDIEKYALESEERWKLREFSTWNDHRGDMDGAYHDNNIRCYGVVMEDHFCMRANTPALYLEINKQIVSRWSSLAPCKDFPLISPTVESKSKNQGCNSSSVGDGTQLGDKMSIKLSSVGKHCKIGDKVKIINSVILNHVKIEDGCVIQGSIISSNATIGANCELKDCIIGSGQNVSESSKHSHESLVDIEKLMEI